MPELPSRDPFTPGHSEPQANGGERIRPRVKRRTKALLARGGLVRRSKPAAVVSNGNNSRGDKPDDRCVGAAYGFDEIRAAPVIQAAAGYAVLSIYFDAPETQRVAGYTSHPIVGWHLIDGDPLPIAFDVPLKFCSMCHVALRSVDGTVCAFDGGWFPNAAAWLANRKRVLGGRP